MSAFWLVVSCKVPDLHGTREIQQASCRREDVVLSRTAQPAKYTASPNTLGGGLLNARPP